MYQVGIIGSGTMGAGIAQVFIEHGYKVVLNDINENFVEKGIQSISNSLNKSVSKNKINEADKVRMLSNLEGSTDLSMLKECLLVIEAVIEDINIKKQLFKNLDDICNPECILATNTSSLSITEISFATKRPDKVIGMHFFNPAYFMALVEVIQGVATSIDTFDRTVQIVNLIGKVSVKVQEAPGFIVNRLLIPMINEAIAIYAEGIADVKDIDTAMKNGANHPIGPLALADLIGMDVVLAIMETLHNEFGEDKYRPHQLLKKMVRGGVLGKKTGLGFYQYE